MNLYQRMWGECGYGKRREKILATNARESRKLAALNRLWHRMVSRLTAPSH